MSCKKKFCLLENFYPARDQIQKKIHATDRRLNTGLVMKLLKSVCCANSTLIN